MMNETFIKEFKIENKSICDNLINYFQENNQYKLPGHTDDKVSSNLETYIQKYESKKQLLFLSIGLITKTM